MSYTGTGIEANERVDIEPGRTKHLVCDGCDREIGVYPLWAAMSARARLKCSKCRTQVTHEHLTRLAADDDYVRAVLIAYGHLVNIGWTSLDALVADGVGGDPRVIGGLLTVLMRAGMIRRAQGEVRPLAVLVDPKPVFVPGPRFPYTKAVLALSATAAFA